MPFECNYFFFACNAHKNSLCVDNPCCNLNLTKFIFVPLTFTPWEFQKKKRLILLDVFDCQILMNLVLCKLILVQCLPQVGKLFPKDFLENWNCSNYKSLFETAYFLSDVPHVNLLRLMQKTFQFDISVNICPKKIDFFKYSPRQAFG